MSETTKIIFACDESGAKGYADKRETYPGEVGVFAGILVPQTIEPKAEPLFRAICNKYREENRKLHIADLLPRERENLRQDVYAVIRQLNLPCFWYGIHVEGLHDWYQEREKVFENARQTSSIVGAQTRYRASSPRDNLLSLHDELFAGLYSHLIAFLEERNRGHVSIEVRTDRIDRSIIKRFLEDSKSLLEEYPHVSESKAWDSLTKQVIKQSIKFDVKWPDSMGIRINVEELEIVSSGDEDSYVVGADVLANSLHYLFKSRIESERYTPLNEPLAIKDHPIADNLAAFRDWGDGDIIGDRLYKHPKG